MERISKELVSNALEKDPTAIHELVSRIAPFIRGCVSKTLMTYRAPDWDSEDLVQEIFLSLFSDDARRLRSWDPEKGSLEGYLFSFVRWKVIAKRRVLHARDIAIQDQQWISADSLVERIWGASNNPNLDAILEKFLSELNEGDRILFLNRFVEKTSTEQIAEKLGINRNSADQRLSRMRKRFINLVDSMKAGVE